MCGETASCGLEGMRGDADCGGSGGFEQRTNEGGPDDWVVGFVGGGCATVLDCPKVAREGRFGAVLGVFGGQNGVSIRMLARRQSRNLNV